MTKLNVRWFTALALIALMVLVPIGKVLPMINHVLTCISELRQQFLRESKVLSDKQKVVKLADTTLTRIITMTANYGIKKQCSDTMLWAAITVKIMYVFFSIFKNNSLSDQPH